MKVGDVITIKVTVTEIGPATLGSKNIHVLGTFQMPNGEPCMIDLPLNALEAQ